MFFNSNNRKLDYLRNETEHLLARMGKNSQNQSLSTGSMNDEEKQIANAFNAVLQLKMTRKSSFRSSLIS